MLAVPIRYIHNCKEGLTPLEQAEDFSQSSRNEIKSLIEKQTTFKLHPPKFSGWYMLELNADSDEEYLDATIFAVSKKKTRAYSLLIINRRVIKRVIWVPPKTKELFFIINNKKVFIRFNQLRLSKLFQNAAFKLMQKKLMTYQPDKQHTIGLQLWRHYQRLYYQQRKAESDYQVWIENHEPRLIKQASHLTATISFTYIIEIPAHQSIVLAKERLESIAAQEYPNQKTIVISSNVSHSTLAKEIIDSSVLIEIDQTRQSSLCLKDLLESSKDEYFITCGHLSKLSPHLSSILCRHVASSPTSFDLLYADHDHLDHQNNRHSPIFKPNWNYDLFLSYNYIGSDLIISRSVLYESSDLVIDSHQHWLYKLILKLDTNAGKIEHLTQILSHRLIGNESYQDTNHKQLELLNKHLAYKGAKAVLGKSYNTFKITWPLPKEKPLVSIIIPTRDGYETLKRTIDSIQRKTTYKTYEIIVVDNGSKERKTKRYLSELQEQSNFIVLTYNKAFNYSAINNYAATQSNGNVLVLLNNDVEIITETWLEEMVSHAKRKEIGCVGALLYYPDERVQHAGVVIGLGGCAGHSHKFYKRGELGYDNRLICTQNYSAVTGACLVVEKSIFNEVNGLNENMLAVAFNDVDFCLKVQANGYHNLWTPWAELYHYESLSRGQDDTKQKRKRLTKEVQFMKDEWHTTKFKDPHYSDMLTKVREDFSLGL